VRYKTRDESLAQAYRSGHYTLAQVGEHFGVSYATVSRAVKLEEGRCRNVKPDPVMHRHLFILFLTTDNTEYTEGFFTLFFPCIRCVLWFI